MSGKKKYIIDTILCGFYMAVLLLLSYCILNALSFHFEFGEYAPIPCVFFGLLSGIVVYSNEREQAIIKWVISVLFYFVVGYVFEFMGILFSKNMILFMTGEPYFAGRGGWNISIVGIAGLLMALIGNLAGVILSGKAKIRKADRFFWTMQKIVLPILCLAMMVFVVYGHIAGAQITIPEGS